MRKSKKLLKYKDLPWELRGQVGFVYRYIQKVQNLTVQENREVIDKLENYMKVY